MFLWHNFKFRIKLQATKVLQQFGRDETHSAAEKNLASVSSRHFAIEHL
jgi:hypothetical protein